MSVSLLEAAKEEASKYISPKDFLCYMSYKLERPIGEVASFLLYSYFDEEVCEYYIDRHYRICRYDDISCDYKTSKLLEEITKDGFFDYLMFCDSFFDDCSSINSDSDFYTPIRIDFYYSIDALEELKFIKKLNLDLKNASALDYTVYSDDTVKAEKPKDERTFKLISLRSHVTVEDITPSIKEYGENLSSKADIFEAIITDKIPAPTVTQTEPPNNNQLIKELAAAKAQITDLKNQLAQAKAELAATQSTVGQPQGFDKYNARRSSFITTGKAVARYLWSIDTTQAIRTGDMVQQLITIMHDIDASLLPDEAAIRVWLSDVAPDYAKKAGKTPNNAPNIIPLDMKR